MDDSMQESWIELHFNGSSGQPSLYASADNVALEQLLMEAQENMQSSRATSSGCSPPSSRGALRSPLITRSEIDTTSAAVDVPQIDMRTNTDWIWDWSSRPERTISCVAVSDGSDKVVGKVIPHVRHGLSVRHSGLLRSTGNDGAGSPPVGKRSFSAWLLTHATSFILGAAAMFIFLKKYCRWMPATLQYSSLK